jgi:hypothetical protein
MPALSGPRSLICTSMGATHAPSWHSNSGFLMNKPMMPHMRNLDLMLAMQRFFKAAHYDTKK